MDSQQLYSFNMTSAGLPNMSSFSTIPLQNGLLGSLKVGIGNSPDSPFSSHFDSDTLSAFGDNYEQQNSGEMLSGISVSYNSALETNRYLQRSVSSVDNLKENLQLYSARRSLPPSCNQIVQHALLELETALMAPDDNEVTTSNSSFGESIKETASGPRYRSWGHVSQGSQYIQNQPSHATSSSRQSNEVVHVEKRRKLDLVEAGKHTVRPFITHGKCEVCHGKASGFLSSSKQCAVCHRLTCSSCVAKVRVLSFHDFRVPHHELFCKKCMRLIHQVDLRAPESVQNLVEYAASSLTGPESSQDSFMSSTRGRAATDDSGEAEDRLNHHATSVTSSHSSSSGSCRALPQPVIGGNHRDHDEEVTLYAHAGGAAPVPKHPGQPTHNNHVKPGSASMPAVPVTIYDGPSPKKSSRSVDAYAGPRYAGQRRHSRSPPDSPEDNYYKGRDSETPVPRGSMAVARLNSASSGPYNGSFSSPKAYDRNAPDPTTDSLMSQIIKMNLMAEQSRQQIQDNLKLARQLSHNSRT